jgi:hypothetical protein
MTERIYNISIAGCSKVAHLHAKAIQSITNARLAGVCNRTYQKAKVELFSAIYRSTRDNMPVKFTLEPEPGFDGR